VVGPIPHLEMLSGKPSRRLMQIKNAPWLPGSNACKR